MDSTSFSQIPYGNNPNAGIYAVLNDVKLYFEIYGSGDPLILLHGNGGNIEGMKYQIEYFAKDYRVIAMDCRGRGKSELGKDPLSYMQMTKDTAALIDYLELNSACFIGRSDGGIISLMMGIFFPEKVKKIAAFGANVWSGPTALYPHEVEQTIRTLREAEEMIKKNDTSHDWNLIRQRFNMMDSQPQLTADDLKKIQAPVLVMSADRDIILEEHTLFIYRNIPNSNLCIFPGETHWMTANNPDLFNSTVARFLSEPFKGEEIRK